jgi:protein-tyrosine-phosphatase
MTMSTRTGSPKAFATSAIRVACSRSTSGHTSGSLQRVDVMRELGIDLADRRPELPTRELAADADIVVTIGCGDECPLRPL